MSKWEERGRREWKEGRGRSKTLLILIVTSSISLKCSLILSLLSWLSISSLAAFTMLLISLELFCFDASEGLVALLPERESGRGVEHRE